MPFEVDQQTLRAAATDVRSTRSDVDGDLRRLRAVIDQLAMAWRGQAGTGFQALMQRWQEDTQKLLVAMDGIADLLDSSGTEHQLTDEAQQQAMSRIHAALNP
jgi:WXG100 family type VII secretion target